MHVSKIWPYPSKACAASASEPPRYCSTCDPDTLQQYPSVLESIVQQNQGSLALDYAILTAGQLNVGDTATLIA